MISVGDSPPGIVSHFSCRCGVRLGTGQVARPSPAPALCLQLLAVQTTAHFVMKSVRTRTLIPPHIHAYSPTHALTLAPMHMHCTYTCTHTEAPILTPHTHAHSPHIHALHTHTHTDTHAPCGVHTQAHVCTCTRGHTRTHTRAAARD